MIKLLIPMGGYDKHGEPFNAAPGDKVELPDKAEKNLISEGIAESVKTVKKQNK